MKKITFILIIFIAFACGDKSKRNTIPRKDLIPLLIDLHLADAIALDNSVRDMLDNPDSASVYSSVFKKHGYEKWQFDSTMKYYYQHTKKLRSIYDEVYAELSRMENQTKLESDYVYKRKTEVIWNQKIVLQVKGDSSNFPRDFIIPIDTIGRYSIQGKIKMDKDDQSVNPLITAYFYSSDSGKNLPPVYFPKATIYKTKYSREYLITKDIQNKSYTHIRITPVKTENKDTIFYKNTQISNFKVHLRKD